LFANGRSSGFETAVGKLAAKLGTEPGSDELSSIDLFVDEKSDSLCESSDLRLVVGSECDNEPCKVASAPVVSTPSTPLLAALTS
jgi:hypothetical protein